MTTFIELGIKGEIANALANHDIVHAFPIQEQTIPIALSGQDIIGQAKTGTGKTFGFALPVLQRINENLKNHVQALIVVPTRELAVQVFQDVELAASNLNIKVVPIYGGKAYEGQIDQLQAGAQVVVGTPGRLLDLNQRRLLDLSGVQEVVLDEADKMLDLGFLPDIEKLFLKLSADRHTMLFSATMPGSIIALARRFMSKPIHIRATSPDEGATQANIKHIVYRAHSLDKDEMIGRLLQAKDRGKTVIFTKTKRQAAKLEESLFERGFAVAAVHGDMNQERREKSMERFKSGKKDVLIATDVAARGIDVDDVTHVVNYTVPDDEETYLHRVGRTGRAGKSGIAVTFIDWDDLHKWGMISRALELNPDPPETYSSSPHFYSDLQIEEGTKGRIAPVSAPQKSTGRAGASKKPTGGKKPVSDKKAAGDKKSETTGKAKTNRQRVRRRVN